MPMPMRDCPVFEVEVTEERSQLVYVAAETKEEAEDAARSMSRSDIDWFSAYRDVDAYARVADALNPADVRHHGVWVPSLKDGQGGWVHDFDAIPLLPPKVDPNQLVLDLTGERDTDVRVVDLATAL